MGGFVPVALLSRRVRNALIGATEIVRRPHLLHLLTPRLRRTTVAGQLVLPEHLVAIRKTVLARAC
jgi:hypothetical protein